MKVERITALPDLMEQEDLPDFRYLLELRTSVVFECPQCRAQLLASTQASEYLHHRQATWTLADDRHTLPRTLTCPACLTELDIDWDTEAISLSINQTDAPDGSRP